MANPQMKIVIGAENQTGGVFRTVANDISGLSAQGAKLDELAGKFSNWAKAMAVAFVSNEVRKFAADSITAYSSLNESVNKAQVVFKGAGQTITDFARNSARDLGMSKQVATEAAGTFGNLFTTMGLAPQASADMSTGLVKLAADLASFNNIAPEEVLLKLRSGLVGEVEPLRVLGINLSAAAVQVQALKMGLGDANKVVDQAGLLQARYALILAQSGNAQGDFARTSDGLANSLRIQEAAVTDLKAALGALTAKPYTIIIQTLTNVATDAQALAEGASSDATTAIGGKQSQLKTAQGLLAAYQKLDETQRQALGRRGIGVEYYQEAIKNLQTEIALLGIKDQALRQATKTRMEAEQALQRELGGSDQAMIRFAQNNLIAAQEAEGAALRNKLLSDSLNDIARNAGLAAAGIGDYANRLQGIVPGMADISTASWNPLALDPLSAWKNAPYAAGTTGAWNTDAPTAADQAEVLQRLVLAGKATELAFLAAAADTGKAFENVADSVLSKLNAGVSKSIELKDFRPGGAGGLMADPNGPFADIFRLQAWTQDNSWGDIAKKYGITSKEQASSLIGKFQQGPGAWDESVMQMFDMGKMKEALLSDKDAAGLRQAAFKKISEATGVGTDMVQATFWGQDAENTGAQTARVETVGVDMAGKLIAGVAKAGPDLEKAGYDNAMAYMAGWNAGMSGKPPAGSAKPPSGSGFNQGERAQGGI
jgi:hypothetical protein